MQKYSVALLAAVLFVSGCQKSLTAKDLEGKWTGKLSMSDADMDSAIKAAQEKFKGNAEALKQLGDKASLKKGLEGIALKLELKADKTYLISQGMGDLTGTWDLSGTTVMLTPTKSLGMTQDEILKKAPPEMVDQIKSQFTPMKMTLDKSGKSFSGLGPGTPGMPSPTMTFTMDAAAAK